jgi:DNA-binding Lrp family transcriptional regulator
MDRFVTEEKVEKIRSFTEKAYETEKHYKEEITLTAEAIEWYNRKLDETLQSLHDHVKRQEHTLQKVIYSFTASGC